MKLHAKFGLSCLKKVPYLERRITVFTVTIGTAVSDGTSKTCSTIGLGHGLSVSTLLLVNVSWRS